MSFKQTLHHVNNVDLNVVEAGHGEPALVFLHYWGGSSRTWLPVIQHLSNTHRCMAIDFRGWGKASKHCDDYSLEILASDALRAAFGSMPRKVSFDVIAGVGHMAPLEAPAQLAAAIRTAATV